MADLSASPSPEWADQNQHDPGISVVQLLVYAIGAAGAIAASVAFLRRRRERRGDPD